MNKLNIVLLIVFTHIMSSLQLSAQTQEIKKLIESKDEIHLNDLKDWHITTRSKKSFVFDYKNSDSLLYRFFVSLSSDRGVLIREMYPNKDTMDYSVYQIVNRAKNYPFNIGIFSEFVYFKMKFEIDEIYFNSLKNSLIFRFDKKRTSYNFDRNKWETY